ncbi:MAG: hypothetical protein N2652_02225 [Kiritimatiellae bacterium]|nr:hypothetical protein [Kiritimatiellia bacterium]
MLPLEEQRRVVVQILNLLQAEVDRLKRLQAQTVAELDAFPPSLTGRSKGHCNKHSVKVTEAVCQVLREVQQPLTAEEITKRILSAGPLEDES